MANAFYNIAKSEHVKGNIDPTTDTLEVALLMSNTTAGTDIDADTVSAISTLDESDDTGYSRVTLANVAISTDDTNDRAEVDADDVSFTGLNGDATRDYVGAQILKKVTDDTDSIPIAYIDFTSSLSSGATQVDIPWDAEGIYQLT